MPARITDLFIFAMILNELIQFDFPGVNAALYIAGHSERGVVTREQLKSGRKKRQRGPRVLSPGR